ncbi:MAG TPA: hypothetical protein DCQ31_18230 [Bacteroidales bacterium]|nr:hypothetical protein [Bacteroidales bacterium]
MIVDAQHPYIGLQSFSEQLKDFFYGRNNEIEQLARLTEFHPTTVLFGKSGLGKTSILHAGLSPYMRKNYFLPLIVRPKIGTRILEDFKDSLINLLRATDPTLPDFEKDNQTITLWEYFHTIQPLNGMVTPVVIVDQFEELFTLGNLFKSEVYEFLTEFSDLAENRIPMFIKNSNPNFNFNFDPAIRNYRVIISIREDYLPQFESLSHLFPAIGNSKLRIEQMKGAQALDAIWNPGKEIIERAEAIKIIELIFKNKLRHEHSETQRAKLQLLGDEGNWQNYNVEPFLLSLICFQINKSRLTDLKEKIDNELLTGIQVEKIIRNFYDQSTEGISKTSLELLEDKLITTDGFRRLHPKNDLIEKTGITEREIDLLINNRIIRTELWNDIEYIEPIHDILVPIMRSNKEERLNQEKERKKRERAEHAFKIRTKKLKEKQEKQNVYKTAAQLLVLPLIIVLSAFLITLDLYFSIKDSNRNLVELKALSDKKLIEANTAKTNTEIEADMQYNQTRLADELNNFFFKSVPRNNLDPIALKINNQVDTYLKEANFPKAVEAAEMLTLFYEKQDIVNNEYFKAFEKLTYSRILNGEYSKVRFSLISLLISYPNNEVFNRYLAINFLVNNELTEAIETYNRYKNKPYPNSEFTTFVEAFKSDLDEFERLKFKHKDFDRIRTLLDEE